MFPQVGYGNSSGPGIIHNEHLVDGLFPFDANIIPPSLSDGSGTVSVVNASTQPLAVPFVDPSTNGNTVVAPSTVSNTGGGPNPSTQASAPPSLLATVESIIASPSQHIIGAIVLAVLAWWFYKHVLKKV